MSLVSQGAPRQTGGVMSRTQYLARRGGRSQMLRDETLDALDHVLHCWLRPPRNTVWHILEQRQLHIPSHRAVELRDLLDHALWDTLIGRALNQQSRGQLDFLAALQDMDEVAFLGFDHGVGHSLLVLCDAKAP